MIKFFRKIRQKLLETGQMSRYLTYAIGEIILVVIGILIALQINNWNEERKLNNTELKLLEELHKDLEETKIDLLSDLKECQNKLVTTEQIYQNLTNEKTIEQINISVKYVIQIPHLYPKLTAYETLKTEGITLISNDQLRKNISDFYQLHLPRIDAIENINRNENMSELKPHLEEISTPIHRNKRERTLAEMYKPDKFADNLYLIDAPSKKLIHMIKNKYEIYQAMLNRYDKLMVYLEELLLQISSEVSERAK